MKLTINSKKTEATQKESSAIDYAVRLSILNHSCACVVKHSKGFGVIESHPYDVNRTGWSIVKIYCNGIDQGQYQGL